MTIAPSDLPDTAPQTQVTPETYFGSNRSQYGYPAPNYPNGTFTIPQQKSVPLDQFAFGGTWTITPEYAQASKGATLTEHFGATKVYMILKPLSTGPSEVAVTYNGKPLTGSLAGSDVVNGIIKVDSDRLYNIFDSGAISTNGTLQFTFLHNGVEAFTFTFG